MAVTAEQMRDVLEEHLSYEVQMLGLAFQTLCVGPAVLGRVPTNLLIASFCIYARNLIDFFTEESHSPKNYAGARHYVGSSWVAFDGQNVKREPFYGKLHNQTAHLTYGREKDSTKKVGAVEMNRAKRLLDAEVKRFVDSLPTKWREIWNVSAAKMGLYH
jgi:hypothetical protein